MQAQTHQPFTYIVGWTKANIYYIGVKYAKGCKPEDLGTTYFTSSKKIGALWTYCEPDFKCVYPFDSPEEALWFEEVLQKEFNVLKSKQFANLHIGGKEFGLLEPISETTRAKMSAAKKGTTQSKETIQKRAASNTGRIQSEETKAKIAAARKLQAAPNTGKKYSEETKAKMSAARKLYYERKRKQQ